MRAHALQDKKLSLVNETHWEEQFLSWFSELKIPALERQHKLGSFTYHYFETAFSTADGRPCSTHGRSQNRTLAAVKAVAEYAERRFMTEFFMENEAAPLISKSFRTSNGWAVHKSQEKAKVAAVNEALERHLLVKAYSAFGWDGFRLIQKIEAKEMDLYFLLSRFTAGGKAAGLVAAKSKPYAGVSFGYCLGDKTGIHSMPFWESGLFEAADKILLLQGKSIDLSHEPESWILSEIKHYLETPFNESVLSSTTGELIDTDDPTPSVLHFDLQKHWKLDFPLHAAYAHGGSLIPLFPTGKMSGEERQVLQEILALNGIDKIPERHPIL